VYDKESGDFMAVLDPSEQQRSFSLVFRSLHRGKDIAVIVVEHLAKFVLSY